MKVKNISQTIESAEMPDYGSSLRNQDFFPKIFLVPSQVRLDKDKGLVVVKRSNEHPDKFDEEDVRPINVSFDSGQPYVPPCENPAGHGLLSLFKNSPNRKIRLAICICVYSEPKHMLKSTIKGIQESYIKFYQKAGIMPHEIILVVIFDGIEKMNCSKDQTQNMISYFNEFDWKNGFRHKPYGRSVEEYVKEMTEKDLENYDDVSVFTEKELMQLKSKLFESQYHEYTRIKNLQQEIQRLKGLKDLRVDQLPVEVYRRYEQLSLNYMIENGIVQAESRQDIQEYLNSKKQLRLKILIEALREVDQLCSRYLESRKDKAILYPVRVEINEHHAVSEESETHSQDHQYMFMCVKHQNGGKLSSHLLFFQGFCKLIEPQFCILLDVGLKPKDDAIFKMWSYMHKNPKVGGVCGYMGLDIENPADDLGYRADGFQVHQLDSLTRLADVFFDLQRAQQFEYHFAHMLDKPFEACFNYVHVLPGAFSGYRWKALQSVKYSAEKEAPEPSSPQTEVRCFRDCVDEKEEQQEEKQEESLMKKYLKTAMQDKVDLDLDESNMYLAQDRIMCLGIHALGYDLAYLPDAESRVDPVTSLTRMLGQRRRWINGSWFAFDYVFKHRHERSSCLFLIQLIYYWLVHRVTYISVALFYIAMTMTVSAACRDYLVPAVLRFFMIDQEWKMHQYAFGIVDVGSIINSIPSIVNFVYIMTMGGIFFLSLNLNQNNDKFSRLYYFTSSLLGFYGCFMFGLLVYHLVSIVSQIIRRDLQGNFIIPVIYLQGMILFVFVGHALPVIWTFSIKKWIEVVRSLPSYIFYVPSYVNILLIYSFCRVDDLSWGTKGLDDDVTRTRSEQWKIIKYKFVGHFLLWNVVVAFVLTNVMDLYLVRSYVILVMTCLVVFLLAFKLIFAMLYLLRYWLRSCCLRFTSDEINQNIKSGKRVLQILNQIEQQIKQFERDQTRLRKEQQYRLMRNSDLFDAPTFSQFCVKMRSRITQHIIDNNVLPQIEYSGIKKQYKSKKKLTLKKKLNIIKEANYEGSDAGLQSESGSNLSRDGRENLWAPGRTRTVQLPSNFERKGYSNSQNGHLER